MSSEGARSDTDEADDRKHLRAVLSKAWPYDGEYAATWRRVSGPPFTIDAPYRVRVQARKRPASPHLRHTRAKFFPGRAIFSNRDSCTVHPVVRWRVHGDTMIELQRKAEKYEGKAAQCRDWAEQAAEGPQRTFFEILADYYQGLAADFRQTIAKRTAA